MDWDSLSKQSFEFHYQTFCFFKQTYTSIKNTMPVVKEMVKKLSIKMNLLNSNGGEKEPTLRIFFPDMGAAVLARRDWKMGAAYQIPQKSKDVGYNNTNTIYLI